MKEPATLISFQCSALERIRGVVRLFGMHSRRETVGTREKLEAMGQREMKKEEVLVKLRELKPRYEEDGVVICGIFGSLARGDGGANSDIDIAYKLDEKLFFSKYGGFVGASKLTSIAKELEAAFQKKVDFVSINSINQELNKAIERDLII